MTGFCSECKYYHKTKIEVLGVTMHGECRRNPPHPMPAYITYNDETPAVIEPRIIDSREDTVGALGYWPAVEPDSWCGEFARKAQQGA